MKFTIHHFAYLTNNINVSIKELSSLGFIQSGSIVKISSQKVNICFLVNQEKTCYELVEPTQENESLKKLITSGITLYHIGYSVKSFQDSADFLKENGYFQINMFQSEAFDNRTCGFFVSRSKKLIELIEL